MIEDCKPSKPTCDADTTPVYEDRTYVLGTNINACSEDSLLTLLSRLKDRVRRLEGLPDGPYHAKRTADLKKAEQAVLNQLNTRF